MPAKNLLRVSDKDTYLHVYNKGVEGRTIFVDKEDSDVFLGFLRDYIINPSQIETQKKSFTVKGKTYHGTPHLPKNYYKKVELIAYSLNADHFHLVLHQRSKNMIQGFIRSLCTRYSIYFNKKYDRRGSLFDGPYKSAHIKDLQTLLHLVTYLHTSHVEKSLSSEDVYLGVKELPWMSKFNFFSNAENETLLPQKTYKEFAENYTYTDTVKALLSSVIIERDTPTLERRILDKDLASNDEPKAESIVTPPFEEKPRKKANPSRLPEYIGLTVGFVVFLALGLRNISIAAINTDTATPQLETQTTPAPTETRLVDLPSETNKVLSASESATPIDPLSLIYSYVVIKKDAPTVVVYKDKDINSGAITTAHAGDHFVAFPLDTNWYEIRFTDDTKGYVLSKYVDIEHSESK